MPPHPSNLSSVKRAIRIRMSDCSSSLCQTDDDVHCQCVLQSWPGCRYCCATACFSSWASAAQAISPPPPRLLLSAPPPPALVHPWVLLLPLVAVAGPLLTCPSSASLWLLYLPMGASCSCQVGVLCAGGLYRFCAMYCSTACCPPVLRTVFRLPAIVFRTNFRLHAIDFRTIFRLWLRCCRCVQPCGN